MNHRKGWSSSSCTKARGHHKQQIMERSIITGKRLSKIWLVILLSFIISSLLFVYTHKANYMVDFISDMNSAHSVISRDSESFPSNNGRNGRKEISGEFTESVGKMEVKRKRKKHGKSRHSKSIHVKKGISHGRNGLRRREENSGEDYTEHLEQMDIIQNDPILSPNKSTFAERETTSETKTTHLENEPQLLKNRVEELDKSCIGRYIYIQRIPRGFHNDMLRDCKTLTTWTNMCLFLSNMGLGPQLANREKAFSDSGWFATNQFSLEVIFHNRMKQYKCLTDNSSLASAVYVPFYAGLDVARYLWNGYNTTMRDAASRALIKYLRAKPEWKSMFGLDHFMVAGRITWDFRRWTYDDSEWGNNLLVLPELKNVTMLVLESSPWSNNDFAIPYPTYFHPSSDIEVYDWQNRMRQQRRPFLYSFAGAPRPNLRDSIRNEIIDQCIESKRKCSLLECSSKANKCHKPVNVMKMFQDSIFCLQPPGDSYTRRSAFDSILAGCIPVFFHPGSAYVQYLWHLPKNYTKYSVFIPMNNVKNKKVSIESILERISTREVVAMREEVIKLIPKMVYADPRFRLETHEDAFDLTVKGVLEKIERVRKEIKEGRSDSFDFNEEVSWKYNLFGIEGAHEWDHFFQETNNVFNNMS